MQDQSAALRSELKKTISDVFPECVLEVKILTTTSCDLFVIKISNTEEIVDIDLIEASLFAKADVRFMACATSRKAEIILGGIVNKISTELMGLCLPPLNACGIRQEPSAGIKYTISHCSNYFIQALSCSSGVKSLGADVEEILSCKDADLVFSQVMTAAEFRCFDNLNIEKNKVVSLVFSAKESLFKVMYRYVGEYFGFLDVEISRVDGHSIQFSLTSNIFLNIETKSVRVQYKIFKDHVSTISIMTGPNEFTLYPVSF